MPVQGWRACYGTGTTTNRKSPMKALAISMVAGAALCSLISVPALAMPMSNLAAAASDLALGQACGISTTITGTDWGVAVITPMEQYRPLGAGDSGITATESFARKQPRAC